MNKTDFHSDRLACINSKEKAQQEHCWSLVRVRNCFGGFEITISPVGDIPWYVTF